MSPNRPHGTRNKYTVEGCRCDPCRQARSDYERRLHYRRVNGTVAAQRVDRYAQVTLHIELLRREGMGLRTIAARSGVALSAVREIAAHRRHWIAPATVAAILAVDPAPAPGTRVPAVGSVRRVRALCWMGWPVAQQAAGMGLGRQVLDNLLAGRTRHINAASAEAIAHWYDAHELTAGPSVRATNRAVANRWAPPLAWDPETIDDPDARPEGRRPMGRRAAA